MASKVKRNTINFNGKMVSIGIDMHKVSWRITALVEGEIAFTGTLVKPNYDSLRKLLARFEGNYVRIAYEAGPGGFSLYDMLTADGIECMVTPPSLIPTESGSRVKTDKKDSLKLAKLLARTPFVGTQVYENFHCVSVTHSAHDFAAANLPSLIVPHINGNRFQIAPVLGICSIILLGHLINISIPVPYQFIERAS